MSTNDPTMVDLTPTPEACRQMKTTMEQSIKTYDQQLTIIADYLQEHDDPFRNADEQFLYDSIMMHVEDLKEQIIESMTKLKEGIAELERCGY